MSEASIIVCKPTQWIKIRAVLIIVMFSVFAYLFYNDGTKGYREKNEHRLYHELFNTVVGSKVDSIGSESEWKNFVATKIIDTPDAEVCPLPKDFDTQQKWPSVIADSYDLLKNGVSGPQKLWTDYAGEKGWDAKPAEKYYGTNKLREQFIFAYLCGGLAVVVIFLFVRTLFRTMEVTEEAYIAPGGKVVPYASMKRIDARKWDTKGVAVVEFEEGGATKKVKIDGMIYGQFKKEDGQPAEKLYEYVLKHFKGEIIEFELVEEDEDAESSEADDISPKNSQAEANS